MPPTRVQVLSLYKSLLREASKFPAYNFRNYAFRRIKDSFKENKSCTDSNLVDTCFIEGKKNLLILQRQVIIGHMYSTDKLVIEHMHTKNR